MKRTFMAAALIAAIPTPALACHHYRVWRYPWPQRCVVGHAYRGPECLDRIDRGGSPAPLPPFPAVAGRPAPESPPALAPVQPDRGPPLTKEEEQAVSVEQLRKALERAHGERPGPSTPTEAQAKSGSTPQPASARAPFPRKGSDRPKVNDVPFNALD